MTEDTRQTQPLTPAVEAPPASATGNITALLRDRNFALLWVGRLVSLLGDQFFFIALPWLVLQLTGNALATGGILATAAGPRALFMLVGGAVTDRFSPRRIMIASNVGQMVLVGFLAALVLTGTVRAWMLVPVALLVGLADAFFFPASGSIVPTIVPKARLGTANSIIQGTEQLSLFVGPVLAGVLIALFGAGGQTDLMGVGLVLAVDAVTFIVAIVTLALINTSASPRTDDNTEGTLTAIRAGLAYVWRDRLVRGYFIMIGLASLFIVGPTIVGIPLLASMRLAGGAAAFGTVMSVYGGGNLLGMIISGMWPAPQRVRGTVLMVTWSLSGVSLAALGLATTTPAAAAVALVMGLTDGYVLVQFITWLQTRTPATHLGRVMSVFMITSVGMAPLSNALAGFVMSINLTAGFVAGGLLMTVTALLGLTNGPMRRMR